MKKFDPNPEAVRQRSLESEVGRLSEIGRFTARRQLRSANLLAEIKAIRESDDPVEDRFARLLDVVEDMIDNPPQ